MTSALSTPPFPFSLINRYQGSNPDLTRLPEHEFSPQEKESIAASAAGLSDSDDFNALAKFCNVWEKLLERHRIPFLLVWVGDIRRAFNNLPTAFELYYEALHTIEGPKHELAAWVNTLHNDHPLTNDQTTSFWNEAQVPQGHRWKSAKTSIFPHYRLQKSELLSLKEAWRQAHHVQPIYWNVVCLQTNLLEYVFELEPQIISTMELQGFGLLDLINPSSPLAYLVSNRIEQLSNTLTVLQDTMKSLKAIEAAATRGRMEVTPTFIASLHVTLMRSRRVTVVPQGLSTPPSLKYINIGRTRGILCKEAYQEITNLHKFTVRFCPHDQVDEELGLICNMINEALLRDLDPFATAAWILDLIHNLHPFEDGNGEIARLLASIPLLQCGLPPLCVPAEQKEMYLAQLNAVRGIHNGDFELFAHFLFKVTKDQLQRLMSMPK